MFLFLEDNDAIYTGRVVALVRGMDKTDGTKILMRDGTAARSGFTPLTIDRRSRRFWDEATNRWKEQHQVCQKRRS